jgi:hypothetical protein
MLEARRMDRLKKDYKLAAQLPSVVAAGQLDDDGTPKRFIAGLKLRSTNPKQSIRLREYELTMVLQGGFEISEVIRVHYLFCLYSLGCCCYF